jgi:pyruvate kinase
MLRRTKIVATLGPASDRSEVLESLFRAGVDVVRLNFSHGTAAAHRELAERVRAAASAVDRDVAILADLQGPKIRIERFRDGPVELVPGAEFCLDVDLAADAGDVCRVGVTYKALPSDVRAGDRLLLNDGLIVLAVRGVDGGRVHCVVELGGVLSNSKGINRQGGGLTAGALTDKDRDDIRVAAAIGVDYVAVSFPRSADDIHAARALLREAGSTAGVVAKIERAEAVVAIDEIVKASDAVMVARGDLAVEIGDAQLPGVQKRIIATARRLDTPVITATQMMESMVSAPTPTRAEVMDVANAVLDGTDAVMLSAESATGRYPVLTVEAMARVCLGAERERQVQIPGQGLDRQFSRVDEAIAMATMFTANHVAVKAIVALTESGSTALWMSRISSGIPIFALTRHEATRRRVTLYRGVYPIAFDLADNSAGALLRQALGSLRRFVSLADGDLVLVTRGVHAGVTGRTDTMTLVRVGDDCD